VTAAGAPLTRAAFRARAPLSRAATCAGAPLTRPAFRAGAPLTRAAFRARAPLSRAATCARALLTSAAFRARAPLCRAATGARALGVVLAALATTGLGACRRAPVACGGGARIALVAPASPVGFDAPFAVEARPLCPEARAGTITWRVAGSAPADSLSVSDGGFSARARTPSLAAALGGPAPWGVVPLSPRTRAEVVLEATWRDGRGAEERHEARVAAAPRARGLPNTPTGARVYLGGAGWRVEARPPR
jgi:hypothetical protein